MARALEEIPEEFLEKLEAVDLFVEDDPSPELLDQLGLDGKDILFGVYQGVPLPEKSYFQGVILPDRITLFRNAFLLSFRSEKAIQTHIKKTLVHEIAHHFGFSESRIRQLGY